MIQGSAPFSVPRCKTLDDLKVGEDTLAGRRMPSSGAVWSAVGDRDGVCSLKINPHHPGDHQVVDGRGGEGTVEVPMVSLDSYLSWNGADRRVAFIKIDVQGHEAAVCRGMENLLASQPSISVSFEYSGHSSDDVVQFFAARDFKMSIVKRNGFLVELSPAALSDAVAKRGYCDILAQKI